MSKLFLRGSLPLLLLLTLGLMAGCPGNKAGKGGTAGKGTSQQQSGIDLEKIAVGLPTATLDYIGHLDFSLAGAKDEGCVYFVVRGETGFELYRRDLVNGGSTLLTTIEDMLPGSLVVSADGGQIVYTRLRDIERYLEAPLIDKPVQVSVVYSFDPDSGEETALFDFRDQAWTPYRSEYLQPLMSASGKRVASLSYDFEESTLGSYLSEWQDLAADYFDNKTTIGEDERVAREKELRDLMTAPYVAPLLREQGYTPSPSGEIKQADREAMQKLLDEHGMPRWALLLWEDGESRLIPLVLPEEYRRSMLSLVVVGDETILLGAQSMDADSPRMLLLRLDEQSGAVSPGLSYSGLPRSLALDESEENLLLVYNPFDAATKTLDEQTHVLTMPLDGAQTTEWTLEGNYADRIDAGSHGGVLAGQREDDQNIYLVRPDSEPVMLSNLSAAIDGIFVTNDGRHIAYLENGFLFGLSVPDNPEQAEGWTEAGYFSKYDELARGFLTQLGFEVPADYEFSWEETEGMGQHEAHGVGHNPATPGLPLLLRYNVTEERFESLWFPSGYNVPNDLPDQQMDAPAVQARADEFLKRTGWLGETAQLYQPGPNPLFDDPTNTQIVVMRDGYSLDAPDGEKWVVNGEATLRITRDSGRISEITLSQRPKVTSAKFELPEDRIAFAIRNNGEQPIPQDAPLRLDLEGRRLVVAQATQPAWAPARLEMPGEYRLCWEVDGYLTPEEQLIMSTWVDVETGDVHGQLYFMPMQDAAQAGF